MKPCADFISERLERFLSPTVRLRGDFNGRGIDAVTFDAAFLQAVDWLCGGHGGAWDFESDAEHCVDTFVRVYSGVLGSIPLFALWRDELKPYAARIIHTREPEPGFSFFNSNASKIKMRNYRNALNRAYACTDYLVHKLAPPLLGTDWSRRLLHLPEISGIETASTAASILEDAALSDPVIYEAAAAETRQAGISTYSAAASSTGWAATRADAFSFDSATIPASQAADAIRNVAKAASWIVTAVRIWNGEANARAREAQVSDGLYWIAVAAAGSFGCAAGAKMDDLQEVRGYWSRALELLGQLCNPLPTDDLG